MEDCSNDLTNSVPNEVTKSANSSNDNQKTCSNCSDANVDLFTCDICAIKQWSEGNGDTPKYYCSCCIMRCTKVGHKIRNLKGQEPLVCSEHKIVKSEYCQTCDVPFCFKCLPKHGKHEPNPLEPKASNRKRKIFDILSQMENAEKPLRKKREKLKEEIDKHQIAQNELKKCLLKKCDDLKGELKKRLTKIAKSVLMVWQR